MTTDNKAMTPVKARALLAVGETADASTLRRAFGQAAKKLHPDRPGGDARRFRDVVDAYRLLQTLQGDGVRFLPSVSDVAPSLKLTPQQAYRGGVLLAECPDGRRLRIRLPAGLRDGDRIRAGGLVMPVSIDNAPDAAVRGHDLWLTIAVPADLMRSGGEVRVPTPIGPRSLQISAREAKRGLMRCPGQGLPARGQHRSGDLFLRLIPDGQAVVKEGSTRALLRRFAAAWAA